MGIEKAGIRFDDRHGTVVGRKSEESISGVDDGGQVESQILGVHIDEETVGETLFFTGGDLDRILMSGQIADNARSCTQITRPQTSTHELDGNWVGFFIGEGEESLGLLAVDELDAEDLGVGEGGVNGDGDGRRLGGVLDHVFEFLWID